MVLAWTACTAPGIASAADGPVPFVVEGAGVVAPRPAATPEDDVVRLLDGSVVRGRIAERNADGTVVMVLPTGEVRTLPAADIAQAATPSMPSGAGVAAPPRQELDLTRERLPGRVPLVLEAHGAPLDVGSTRGEVQRVLGDITYDPQCLTPCTLWARPGVVAIASGGRGRRLELYTLDVPPSGLRVVLRSASAKGRGASIALVVLGALSVAVGGLLWGLDVQLAYPHVAPPPLGASITFLGVGGLAVGVVFVALTSTGIARSAPMDAHGSSASLSHWAPRRSWFLVPAASQEAIGLAAQVNF